MKDPLFIISLDLLIKYLKKIGLNYKIKKSIEQNEITKKMSVRIR